MDLDFTGLSDDQIITLVRAALREMTARGAATSAAMRDALLDESERASIARQAGAQAAAALRAQERERIAREAADAVRAQHAAEQAAVERQRGEAAAQVARDQQLRQQRITRDYLTQAAALVGEAPQEIAIWVADTRYGRRVMINEGCDRYTPDHLADYNVATGAIKTPRSLVTRKPDIAAFCAAYAIAAGPSGARHSLPTDVDWSAQ